MKRLEDDVQYVRWVVEKAKGLLGTGETTKRMGSIVDTVLTQTINNQTEQPIDSKAEMSQESTMFNDPTFLAELDKVMADVAEKYKLPNDEPPVQDEHPIVRLAEEPLNPLDLEPTMPVEEPQEAERTTPEIQQRDPTSASKQYVKKTTGQVIRQLRKAVGKKKITGHLEISDDDEKEDTGENR